MGDREYEMDKLKRRLRDVEDERDGMEKKWLDQVQNQTKEKYLIADLQKEVLLWKGKFKNLLDRIQSLECDARRDFDYSCRRSSLGDIPNEFVSPAERSPRDSRQIIDAPSRIVRVPVTCSVPVVARERGIPPQLYRPDSTIIYGYPSHAVRHPALMPNGIPSQISPDYYEPRREVAMGRSSTEESREHFSMATSDEADDKEIEVDVEGKHEKHVDDHEESAMSKRLVMPGVSTKAKIVVRKRSDPSRYETVTINNKRKRLSR